MSSKTELKLSFKVTETTEGYMAQGMEIPGIMIESPTMEKLHQVLTSACECYFKSFPEDLQKHVLAENELIKSMNLTI